MSERPTKRRKLSNKLKVPKVVNVKEKYVWCGSRVGYGFSSLMDKYEDRFFFGGIIGMFKRNRKKFVPLVNGKYTNVKDLAMFITRSNNSTDKKLLIFGLHWDCGSYKHFGTIVYNKHFGTVERFEPHGLRDCGSKKIYKNLDISLKAAFKMVDKDIEYLPPLDLCPQMMGSYRKDWETGYCAAWSVWYSELRILNPYISQEELVAKALEYLNDVDDPLYLIRHYAQDILSCVDDPLILQEISEEVGEGFFSFLKSIIK